VLGACTPAHARCGSDPLGHAASRTQKPCAPVQESLRWRLTKDRTLRATSRTIRRGGSWHEAAVVVRSVAFATGKGQAGGHHADHLPRRHGPTRRRGIALGPVDRRPAGMESASVQGRRHGREADQL
jgi:hypothetical protein